ncbi:hypothetical protein QTH89_21215 [Variovorax sp. J22G21]|uniref:hypothetical protein n=1 Tax=Variovorax fucosicus TaxID=3053517 RepID=UPI0025764B5B|nr:MULTISPECIES: hypothetical protein [unclassified Variovorax]MDM0038967.1 hypothetical protein [Variovorax sp. J22R193]MDM0063743.1 hypothetical protein [Variovorax sp. J22G21]
MEPDRTTEARLLDVQAELQALEPTTEDEASWEAREFFCQELAPANYLLTYTLHQGHRVTRRATLWRRVSERWQVVYHQGTPVAGANIGGA